MDCKTETGRDDEETLLRDTKNRKLGRALIVHILKRHDTQKNKTLSNYIFCQNFWNNVLSLFTVCLITDSIFVNEVGNFRQRYSGIFWNSYPEIFSSPKLIIINAFV